LAQVEVTTEESRAVVMTANEATEKATVTIAAAEAVTQTAAQAPAQEKTTLESMVVELEQDLGTAGADLRTTNK
jgi:hypothetical protein